jgi:lysozyme
MPDTNAIIDLSHFNQHPDFEQAKGDGILGVFHKATQGTRYFDPTYIAHRNAAQAAGLLWGAYHFGTGADGVEQAEFFLQKVAPAQDVLLVLDFEFNPQGPTMTLEEARAFVTHIQSVTGRYPGLYAGAYLKEKLGTQNDPVLANCWFWLSQFGPTAVVPPNWPAWTMWQYTDGGQGVDPQPVAGIGRCDRDRFNGTAEDLRRHWIPTAAAAAGGQ